MAIVDLIEGDEEIYIPVFMGDSSVPLINKKTKS